ncbi:hydroxymethylglutaryl-CoA reductase, degradative [Candidatus Micrarchaeota archaeon]|nr:hydroxymethylglutaryl-CoA reductase, degradative [Candidatus Micrarchaeota archaeon]
MMTSQIKWNEFHKKSLQEKIDFLKKNTHLTKEEFTLLENALSFETANNMIENAIGTFQLPLGIATNFKINGIERLIPFVIEEPSVVAAASKAAEITLPQGFTASTDEPIMIGQVQLVNVPDAKKAIKAIEASKKKLIDSINDPSSTIFKQGGGAKNFEAKIIQTTRGECVCVYLEVNVQDAMGANTVNSMCEKLAPLLEELTGGEARLRILSNLAVKRLARAKAVWTKDNLEKSFKGEFTGEEIIERFLDCYAFAEADPYRAVTHNKGIMNGIDAVVIATGNDFRAIEAGAHAFASLTGRYKPLTKYYKNKNGDLVGEIELPLALGIVGGATKTHPLAQMSLKLLGVKTAKELAEIIACVGLAQNFAAVRALSTEGINRGHMRLHANNIAVMAGAKGEQIRKIAEKMYEEKNVKLERAKELMK